MELKNFRVKIIVRLIILSLSLIVFMYAIMQTKYYFIMLLLGITTIYQIISLIKFIERTNKNIFAQNEHFCYIQNIIQYIDTGIISYRNNGDVEIINNAAKKLLEINTLKNIKELEKRNKKISETLKNIKAGENILIKTQEEETSLQLTIYATELKLKNKTAKLVSIKNIQKELEEQEMASWQKLIKVLTHEIMNSITPIVSLTETANELIKEVPIKTEDDKKQENIDDIINALNTIHKRSTSLMQFVATYKNLSRIPKPKFETLEVKKLLHYVKKSFEKEVTARNIECNFSVIPADLKLKADENLIKQVLINIITNAIHATKSTEKPKIEIKAFLNKRNRITIEIIDNGQGIIKEVKDKIFIPFFTTKAGGSGIGLSLSKQILRLHNGTISVQSEVEERTQFTLTF